MPTYRMKAPDGVTYKIEGPPDATEEQVRNEIIRQNPKLAAPPSTPPAEPEAGRTHDATVRTEPPAEAPAEAPYYKGHTTRLGAGAEMIGDTGASIGKALGNIPADLASVAGNIYRMRNAPTQIARAAEDPGEVVRTLQELGWSGIGHAFWDPIAEKYGGLDKLKKTFEEHPVELATDLLAVYGGGVGLVKALTGATRGPLEAILSRAAPNLSRAFQEGRVGGPSAQAFRTGIGGGQVPQPVPPAMGAPAGMGPSSYVPWGPRGPGAFQAGQALRRLPGGPGMPSHIGGMAGHAAGQYFGGPVGAYIGRSIGEGAFSRLPRRMLPEMAGRAAYRAGQVSPWPTRAAITAAASKELKEAKKDYSTADAKVLRAVQKENATADQMTAARDLMKRKELERAGRSTLTTDPMSGAAMPGPAQQPTQAQTPQTPNPGQSSYGGPT
jgi:hypothetical protein